MSWTTQLEEYFDDISPDLQAEVRDFLDEYYEKKNTHSATSLKGLSDEELENLLYLEIKDENLKVLPQKIQQCKNLKILDINTSIKNLFLIKNLSELRILGLSGVKIEEDNDFFENYHNLIVLGMTGHSNFDFSKEINRLSKLLSCYIEDFLSDTSDLPLIQSFPEKISNAVYITINSRFAEKTA